MAASPPRISECLFGTSRKSPKLPKTGANIPVTVEPRTSKSEAGSTPDDSSPHSKRGEETNHHDINMAKLRRVCSQGIPDEGSHRGVAWRVLLGYLDTKNIHKSWAEKIPPQREFYASLVQQYFEGPLEHGKDLRGNLSKMLRDRQLRKKYYATKFEGDNNTSDDDSMSVMSEQTMDSEVSNLRVFEANQRLPKLVDRLPAQFRDAWNKEGLDLDSRGGNDFSSQMVSLGINPLKVPVMETEGEFERFLEDANLLVEIRKDVARTHPDLFFYLEPKDHLGMRRYGALERILFIWSKLNKGVRYVQGMNEIVGTIYYVLANDHNSEWANHAEADAYFLFHAIMLEMRDVFVPDMDATHTGIQGRIGNLQNLLKTHDPEVYEHLQEYGIDASFFAIRWLTTLLSREFLLPDTIRLWDSMFASTHKENFLRYACGTMVLMVREDLLKADFGQCLRLLQSYPPQDVDSILESSRSLWIYESQITLACHKGGISLHQALQAVTAPPTIIMAFGMRGGVAPRISLPFTDAVSSTNNGNGFIGRARRFWGGRKETKSKITTDNQDMKAKNTVESVEPPSRLWDRTDTLPPETERDTATANPSTRESPRDPPGFTRPPPPGFSTKPPRRIWNRRDQDSESATTITTATTAATAATAASSTTDTTTQRPLWGW